MRARQSGPKASFGKFNIVPTAECKCGDRLQTEERVFWDLNLTRTKGQQWWIYCLRKAKKDYPELWPEGKRCMQGICFFRNKIPNLCKKFMYRISVVSSES
jgi:hypothetical protein